MRYLKDKKIILTREAKNQDYLKYNILKQGGSPIAFPVIKAVPSEDIDKIDRTIKKIPTYDWIIFSSVNGVNFFLNRVQEFNIFQNVEIAVVGKKTAQSLSKFGLSAKVIAKNEGAVGLLMELEKLHIKGQRFLIPASNISSPLLSEKLREMGGFVDNLITYKTESLLEGDKQPIVELFDNNKIDCIIFFSPSAVRGFFKIIKSEYIKLIKRNQIAIAAIGKTTGTEIEKLGIRVNIIPQNANEECLFRALLTYFRNSEYKKGFTKNENLII